MTPEIYAIEKALHSKEAIASDILYGNYKIQLFVKNYDKPLIITFAPFGETDSLQTDINKEVWGYKYFRRKSQNIIAISSVYEETWYRCQEIERITSVLGKCFQHFPEVLGYGGSMGGFAIGAFSQSLNLDRVLLLNPFSTLAPELVPFETRFQEYKEKLNWSDGFFDAAACNCKGFVVYDSIFKLDKMHAKRFKTLTPIIVPGVGHKIPMHLANFGALELLVDGFIVNNFDHYKFSRQIRRRHFYPHYFDWMLSSENLHLTPARRQIIEKQKKLLFRLFDNQSSGPGIDSSGIDVIRDSALALESGSLEFSYRLMKIAHLLRPEGKFIKDKLDIYEQMMNNKKVND